MQDLDQLVYKYYVNHFDSMQFDKQFHFATRMYLWNQDDFAHGRITSLEDTFTANGQPARAMQQIYTDSLTSPVHGTKNAAELRKPYFEKYPTLKRSVLLLFRTAFLKHIYGYDVRDDLFNLIPQSDFDELAAQLLADDEAISILSTHAINFLYLYSRVVTDNNDLFDPKQFLTIGSSRYDASRPVHLQLLIYLYTHCIIGESKFYYRAVPTKHLDVYQDMASQLETILDEHFSAINLDNKFEHLVCCKLVGITSRHADAIYAEAAASLSKDGDFLVDTINANPQRENIDLDKSEHRNVLFLLSNREFKPLS